MFDWLLDDARNTGKAPIDQAAAARPESTVLATLRPWVPRSDHRDQRVWATHESCIPA